MASEPEPSRLRSAGEGRLGLINHLRLTVTDLLSPGFHHLAWNTDSRGQVDELYRLLVASGATVLDPPAEYDYEPGYYAVFFVDPDGLKLEFVHVPERPWSWYRARFRKG